MAYRSGIVLSKSFASETANECLPRTYSAKFGEISQRKAETAMAQSIFIPLFIRLEILRWILPDRRSPIDLAQTLSYSSRDSNFEG